VLTVLALLLVALAATVAVRRVRERSQVVLRAGLTAAFAVAAIGAMHLFLAR
jgi:hypothetical protein